MSYIRVQQSSCKHLKSHFVPLVKKTHTLMGSHLNKGDLVFCDYYLEGENEEEHIFKLNNFLGVENVIISSAISEHLHIYNQNKKMGKSPFEALVLLQKFKKLRLGA